MTITPKEIVDPCPIMHENNFNQFQHSKSAFIINVQGVRIVILKHFSFVESTATAKICHKTNTVVLEITPATYDLGYTIYLCPGRVKVKSNF